MKTKKVMISGLAFDSHFYHPSHWLSFLNSGEAADMAKLQFLAKQGWMVTKIKGVHYLCEESEPMDVKFAIDYCDQVDDDYFKTFEASGWTHVDSVDYIHLFKANIDATPLVTDQETRLEKMMHEQRRFGKYTLLTVATLLLVNWITTIALNTEHRLFIAVMIAVTGLSLVAVVFTLLPFFGYFSRVNKIKKQRI